MRELAHLLLTSGDVLQVHELAGEPPRYAFAIFDASTGQVASAELELHELAYFAGTLAAPFLTPDGPKLQVIRGSGREGES